MLLALLAECGEEFLNAELDYTPGWWAWYINFHAYFSCFNFLEIQFPRNLVVIYGFLREDEFLTLANSSPLTGFFSKPTF